MITGPNECYTFTGYGSADVKPGPRTADINIDGIKRIVFRDGQTITCSCTSNKLLNIFVGVLGWQTVGK